MHRSARTCVAVLAAAAAPIALAPAALAQSAALTAETGAYFSASGVPDSGTDAGKPPNLTQQVDGVSAGNLAVAARGGQEDKVSFLRFDLSSLEPGTTVTRALLSVPLTEPDPPRDVFIADNAERVQACAAGDEGFGGEDGESLSVAPSRLCEEFSDVGAGSADGTRYEFDVTALAAGWVDGANDGIALTTTEDARNQPFQVVFRPAVEATLTLETTAPAPSSAPAAPAPSAPVDGGSSGSAPLDSGFSGGSTPMTFDDLGLGTVEPPSVAVLEPLDAEVAAEPPPLALDVTSAPEVATPVEAVTAALAGSEAPLNPTASFWFGSLLLAGVLVLLSLILGDPTVPQQAAGSQSRLARALQGRTRGLGGASL